MTTFCRITGKSRGLPKPNYFPLLPPISPADAKRLCRITGKAVGQPTHHYLPVLVARQPKGKKQKQPDRVHTVVPGLRYLYPSLESNTAAESLAQLLAANADDTKAGYVYTVRERQCGLVFPARLEAAVRGGDVRDVMLAKDEDILLLKLKKGPDVSLEVKELNIDKLDLFEGEGVAKIVRRKKSTTDSIRKIFEEKELTAEKEAEVIDIKPKKAKERKWKNIVETKFKNDFIKEVTFDSWSWNEFDNGPVEPLASHIPTPVSLKALNVDLKDAKPGIIQQPYLGDCVGLETAVVVAPFKPLIAEPEEYVVEKVRALNPDQLERMRHVEVLREKNELLPSVSDLAEVVRLLQSGVEGVEECDNLKIHGVHIDVGGKKKFVVGQMIESEEGLRFVPGQTVSAPSGQHFLPGFTVCTSDGPKALPGYVVQVEGKAEFVAGRWTLTNAGEKFVQGQVLQTGEGTKFVPGQTVRSGGRLKFVPGQIYEDRFVPGQTVAAEQGVRFVPGQTVQTETGEVFIPGQSMWSENGWDFVPGMADEDSGKFVPGKVVVNSEWPNGMFVPGQFSKVGDQMNFVPGIVVEDDGLKFICGKTVETPEGSKFIQGLVVKSPKGVKFVPGVTNNQNGEVKFHVSSNLEELKYEEVPAENFRRKSLFADGVFGQMVQSSHGVEFFPGDATCLPKGKVVPGKLVRGEEVKFVPGLMIDGCFVPGQVVMTDKGDHFIPGQVVETAEGPKFVPGQIIQTKSGEKFVPGQTIETEEGPKFVPGQIVETKAGPTFIPGQVIQTGDGGSKFVPGQVVDTVEGPRFVPGRVVEAGDFVTFIPGQVVQTEGGPRFVAPDLTGGGGGEGEFTVQGFDVPPEELGLLRPRGADVAGGGGEMAIDSRMLRQLAEAGMSIGRQVSAEIPEVTVRSAPAMSTACALGQKLKLDPVTTVKVSQIIAAVVQIGKLGEIPGNTEEIQTLNRILERVVHCRNEEEAYKLISNIIVKEFSTNILDKVDKIHAYIVSHESPLKKLNKINIMKEILNCNVSNVEILDKLVLIMNEEDEMVSVALQRIHEAQPEIVSLIVQRFTDSVGKLENEKDVVDTLHKSIVSSVREASEMSIVDLMKDTEGLGLKTLILEAVALAKALEMHDVATTLLNIMSNPKCTDILAGDRVVLEILRKLTVMRKLAARRPELLAALKNLNANPYDARTDPNLVQLAKESQALLVIPEEGLATSNNVPAALFFSQNSLAMEEFLSRTKREYRILVIIKNGIQAIIPREASHSVLTGSVPYAVLDEKGLRYFQPKHVFSALKLPKIATRWFSLYMREFKDVTNNNIPNVNSFIETN